MEDGEENKKMSGENFGMFMLFAVFMGKDCVSIVHPNKDVYRG